MNSRRARILRITGLILWALIAVLYAIKAYAKLDYTDFDVYLRAATRAVNEQWQEVYSLNDGASPYRYLPFLLPYFLPFTWISPATAKVLWCLVQWLSFTGGFIFLYRVARTEDGRGKTSRWGLRSQLALGLGVLAGLRFVLDSLSIGQVAGPMFLGYCVALWAWVNRRPFAFGVALAIPALLKISPGVLLLLPLCKSAEYFLRALRGLLAVLFCSALLLAFWIALQSSEPTFPLMSQLFHSWVEMVRLDSVYYDASHYGSQSLWSALLRATQWGWIDRIQAEIARLLLSLGFLTSVIAVWLTRKSRGTQSAVGEFALGLYLPIFLMPETFKYSLTPLIIPFVFFAYFIPRFTVPLERRLALTIAVFTVLVLSLAGKDILDPLHPRLFFWLQEKSFPFLAVLSGYLFLFVSHWRRSTPRFFARSKPQVFPAIETTAEIDSFTLFVVTAEDRASLYLQQFVHQTLQIPEGAQVKWVESKHLAAEVARTASRWIGFLNPEQVPFNAFYAEAIAALGTDPGCHLVRANRRDPRSRFQIPVKSFSKVFFRHQLGKTLNRLFKVFFQVSAQDTQSGICVIRRSTWIGIQPLLEADDFMQPLEWSLLLQTLGLKERELPVEFRLFDEKASSQVLEECVSIARYLPVLFWRYRLLKRWRAQLPNLHDLTRVTADDWGLSRGINEGVIALAQLGVLHRASAMTDSLALHHQLSTLVASPQLQLGLHFNLTYRTPLIPGATTPLRFLIQWTIQRLSPARRQSLADRVRVELEHQLSSLKFALDPLGKSIRYLDGHHHVHIFPGILALCAPILKQYGIKHVRIPLEARLWLSPLFILNVFAFRARQVARRHGLEFYPVYYPLPRSYAQSARLSRALIVRAHREIICHPAARDDVKELTPPDRYSAERVTEFRFWQWFAYTRKLALLSGAPTHE